ncbi:hypothetical protein BT69DRAFT_1050441 [Atractiella rhizophila]|nr:hypothetical protein BT69DRAFT_1050441 [Atractiella rhizophila]
MAPPPPSAKMNGKLKSRKAPTSTLHRAFVPHSLATASTPVTPIHRFSPSCSTSSQPLYASLTRNLDSQILRIYDVKTRSVLSRWGASVEEGAECVEWGVVTGTGEGKAKKKKKKKGEMNGVVADEAQESGKLVLFIGMKEGSESGKKVIVLDPFSGLEIASLPSAPTAGEKEGVHALCVLPHDDSKFRDTSTLLFTLSKDVIKVFKVQSTPSIIFQHRATRIQERRTARFNWF